MLDPSNDCIGGIGRGDGPSARDGRQATFLSTMLKGNINIVQTGVGSYDMMPTVVVTLYLVLDKQTNGVQMNSEQPFTSPAPASALPSQAMLDLSETHRFRVLKKKRFVIEANAATTALAEDEVRSGQKAVPFTMYQSYGKGMRVNYLSDVTGGAIAGVTDNSVHLIGFVDQVTGTLGMAGFSATVQYSARTRFVSA